MKRLISDTLGRGRNGTDNMLHPSPGDALMIEKPNGHCDVRTMNADGLWDDYREGITNVHTAWYIARANILISGCRVWYRHDAELDSAIRPY
jgi:hypothetical protein